MIVHLLYIKKRNKKYELYTIYTIVHYVELVDFHILRFVKLGHTYIWTFCHKFASAIYKI